MSNPANDRRENARRPFESRVAIKTDTAIYFMESENISAGGALVHSEIQIPSGTTCTFVPFVDECANIFEAVGTVVRCAVKGPQYGMGIRFERLAQSDLEILEGIVSEHELPVARLA